MSAHSGGSRPVLPFVFDERIWREEAARSSQDKATHDRARRARRLLSNGYVPLQLFPCDERGHPPLIDCIKVYVPVDRNTAAEAPYGFVFQLAISPGRSAALDFVAFGERHPRNPAIPSVYERAYRRLNGSPSRS